MNKNKYINKKVGKWIGYLVIDFSITFFESYSDFSPLSLSFLPPTCHPNVGSAIFSASLTLGNQFNLVLFLIPFTRFRSQDASSEFLSMEWFSDDVLPFPWQ